MYSHNENKKYRDIFIDRSEKKQSKLLFKFFEFNWNNIKNTLKRIKSLIKLNDISTIVPRTLSNNNSASTKPVKIANILNIFSKVSYFYFFSLVSKGFCKLFR